MDLRAILGFMGTTKWHLRYLLMMFVIFGDSGFDELLVGAPMYRADGTRPETGRVYIYNNIAVSVQR